MTSNFLGISLLVGMLYGAAAAAAPPPAALAITKGRLVDLASLPEHPLFYQKP
jgi:hypothetical protein